MEILEKLLVKFVHILKSLLRHVNFMKKNPRHLHKPNNDYNNLFKYLLELITHLNIYAIEYPYN